MVSLLSHSLVDTTVAPSHRHYLSPALFALAGQGRDENPVRLHWAAVPTLPASVDNIDNAAMDPTALRRRFNTMCANNNNEIPVGYRRDAFFYLDEEAFGSGESTRPFLWLAEPDPEPQPSTATEPGPDFQPLKYPSSTLPRHFSQGSSSATPKARRDASPIGIPRT